MRNHRGRRTGYQKVANSLHMKSRIVEILNATVAAELEELPDDMHTHSVRHLDGPLWEFRMKGRDGTSRAR